MCILISSELINNFNYKTIYQINNNEMVIYYFYAPDAEQPVPIPSIEKYKLQGIEIYRDGELIKDTFKGNNHF
jgi:hypothetical protein